MYPYTLYFGIQAFFFKFFLVPEFSAYWTVGREEGKYLGIGVNLRFYKNL